MARQRLVHCDLCGEDFWFEISRRLDPNPDVCPVCENTGKAKVPKIKLSPRIAQMVEERRPPGSISNHAKSMDQTYRMMEATSAERAQEAADMLGVPVSEMSHLKTTDMKDNVRAGDTTMVLPPVSEEVRKAMEYTPGAGFGGGPQPAPAVQHNGAGGFGGANGPSIAAAQPPAMQHIPATAMGGAGSTALGNIQQHHMANARAMVAKGEKGRHAG